MIVRNGRAEIEDLGPARARCAGYGGSLLSHPLTIVPMKFQPRAPKTEFRPEPGAPTCGYLLPKMKVPCMRGPGHLPSKDHRSAEAMKKASLREAARP